MPIYLYIVPFFPSSNSWRGGFFLDAVKALIRDGRYDVRVLSTGAGYDYEIEGIKVYGIGSFKIGCSDYFSTITDIIKLWLFNSKLKQMKLSPKDISVCHVHLLERMAIYSDWIKRKNKECFTLIHHHLTGMSAPEKSKLHWLFPFENEYKYFRLQKTFERADLHVFCSEMARDGFGKVFVGGLLEKGRDYRCFLKFSKWLKPLKYKESIVVYNGIDDTSFFKDDSKKAVGCFKIGCVANFIETKGQRVLIDAFIHIADKIPTAKLFFVGTGRTLEDCKKRVTDFGLNDRIVFCSEISHTMIKDFYQSLDLYVLPSYYEAFNCSLIEAYSCGSFVITTDVISFKEVLNKEYESLYLVPPMDHLELAKKILWVYTERPKMKQLKKNLNIDVITKEFLDKLNTNVEKR